MEYLAPIAGIALLSLYVWSQFAILRKMGFSPWLAFLVAPTSCLGIVVFAFIEWPIERELAWHRFRQGNSDEELIGQVEAYAVYLEGRDEWQLAMDVYDELTKRATSEQACTYYRNCLEQLKDRATNSLGE